MAQRPTAQIRPNTAKLCDDTTATHPPMTGRCAAPGGAAPGGGSSRPRSTVRSHSGQGQPAATPRIQTGRAARDLGEPGQRPFPGGGRNDRRRPATRLAAHGRGCGPRAHAPCRGPGGLKGVADGGVVVLVDMAGVHVLPLLAMPQLLGDMGMLVPVHLGVMARGCRPWQTSSRVALPARTPPRLLAQHPPRLTAKLTANPPDNRGPRRTALDGYTRPELRRCGGR